MRTSVSGFSRTSSDSHPSLLAVTTDCRALSNEAAEQRTYEALQRLMTAGIERIFLKIDSTMRGSVPGQIAGALRAWRTRHADACAVVCPAYPHMGRTVESNRLLVHGQPVHETAIGRDPISPVRTSEMSSLLPSIASVVVPDAVSGDDLREIAARIAAKGPAAIAVGSGGLAGALAEVWSVREIWSVRSVRLQPDPGGQPDLLSLPSTIRASFCSSHPSILCRMPRSRASRENFQMSLLCSLQPNVCLAQRLPTISRRNLRSLPRKKNGTCSGSSAVTAPAPP